ncbi:MAG: hypothetical protein A2Y10_03065 [Planctomycetes bacterium GWF2_41_51]|nr:MAG: hypothetical protein A2Y10_03065 [Planctomycetes bacterium GWF2_41_51]HBG26063.1 hypothetical protein [Phycisphaerales bacterium]
MRLKKVILVSLFLKIFVFSTFGAEKFTLPRIEKLRSFDTKINLSNGGFIVVPNDSNYVELADRINDQFQKLVKTEYVIDTKFEIKPSSEQVIIAMGNMINNPIIENLYWNFYTYVNPTWPGEKGYVIETVYQPLPFFSKNNVVVLGGISFNTTKQAVEAFLNGLKTSEDCQIGPTLKVVNTGANDDIGDYRKLKGLRGFRGLAECFHKIGDKKYLDEAITILNEQCTKAEQDTDWVLVWPDETDAFRAICAWDFVQEFANLSDKDKLRYEQFFLDINQKLIERAETFEQIKPGSVLTWNHTAIPLLAMYTSARYYKAHYGFEEMDEILSNAQWYFMGQAENYRVSCDAFTYDVLSIRSPLVYYVMTNQMEYFENGNADKFLNYLLSQLDNDGRAGGVGDVHPYEWIEDNLTFDILDWKLKSAEMLWFKKPQKSDYERIWYGLQEKTQDVSSKFYPDLKPQKPKSFEGCVSIEFDNGMYEHLKNQGHFRMVDVASLPKLKPNVPYEKAFDKLQFRSFEPDGGEYLLIDGFGQGNHFHLDTGAIVCAVLGGYRFLCDADYLVNNSNEHSMLTIVKDGQAQLPVPPCAELANKVNFDNGAYASIRISDYSGMAWDRHIFWLKNKYFAVIDTLTAQESGTYRTDCVWKVLDRGMENFDDKELICQAPNLEIDKISNLSAKTFHLRSTDNGRWDRKVTENGTKMRIVHQTKTSKLKAGEKVSYQNIFYIERADELKRLKQYTPVQIMPAVLKIESDSDSFIIIGKQNFGDIRVDTDFAYIEQGRVIAVNDGSLTAVGEKFSSRLFDTLKTLKPAVRKNQKIESKVDLKPLWSRLGGLVYNENRDICTADLTKNGTIEIVVCNGKNLICFKEDGSELWSFENTVDLSSCEIISKTSTNIKIVAGTTDAKIIGLNSNGKLIKTAESKLKSAGQYGLQGNRWVTHLRSFDLDNDGRDEIIAGLRTWQVHVFDNNLEPRWYNSMALHGVADIVFGVKRNEVNPIYLGDMYGGVYAFDFSKDETDALLRKAFLGVGNVSVAILDINKDGVEDIIAASSCGRMSAYDGSKYVKDDYYNYDRMELQKLWTFNSYGFGYSAIKIISRNEPVLVTSSLSGYLYLMNPANGKIKTVIDATEPVCTFEVIGDKIIAGTLNSFVVIMDFKGTILGKSKVSDSVLKIKPIGTFRFAALTSDGQICMFKF